jgi:hypothetical protein
MSVLIPKKYLESKITKFKILFYENKTRRKIIFFGKTYKTAFIYTTSFV